MITCYPIWTTTPRAVIRHTIHRITHHTLRHALVVTVRIVCVAVPAWIATPSPAAAPSVPEPFVMPPPMLPWPGDEVPGGWGAGDLGGERGIGGTGAEMKFLQPNAWTSVDQAPDEWATRTIPTQTVVDRPDAPNQPVPEPGGVAVLGVGLLVLGIFKGVRR